MAIVLPDSNIELLELLGGDRSHDLWRALMPASDGLRKLCVVKWMTPADGRIHELRTARFVAEAHIGQHLCHRNLVRVFGSGTHEDRTYVTGEYVDGYSLSHLAEANPEGLDVPTIAALAYRVASALAYTHAARTTRGAPLRVVHGGLRPSQILIQHDGTPKLTMMSLAALEGESLDVRVEGPLNRPGFMAPEQIVGAPLDGKTDVFALGLLLIQLVARYPLDFAETFDADELADAARLWCMSRPSLPPAMVDLCLSMIDPDPTMRPTSAEVRKALLHVNSELGSPDVKAGLRAAMQKAHATARPADSWALEDLTEDLDHPARLTDLDLDIDLDDAFVAA